MFYTHTHLQFPPPRFPFPIPFVLPPHTYTGYLLFASLPFAPVYHIYPTLPFYLPLPRIALWVPHGWLFYLYYFGLWLPDLPPPLFVQSLLGLLPPSLVVVWVLTPVPLYLPSTPPPCPIWFLRLCSCGALPHLWFPFLYTRAFAVALLVLLQFFRTLPLFTSTTTHCYWLFTGSLYTFYWLFMVHLPHTFTRDTHACLAPPAALHCHACPLAFVCCSRLVGWCPFCRLPPHLGHCLVGAPTPPFTCALPVYYCSPSPLPHYLPTLPLPPPLPARITFTPLRYVLCCYTPPRTFVLTCHTLVVGYFVFGLYPLQLVGDFPHSSLYFIVVAFAIYLCGLPPLLVVWLTLPFGLRFPIVYFILFYRLRLPGFFTPTPLPPVRDLLLVCLPLPDGRCRFPLRCPVTLVWFDLVVAITPTRRSYAAALHTRRALYCNCQFTITFALLLCALCLICCETTLIPDILLLLLLLFVCIPIVPIIA